LQAYYEENLSGVEEKELITRLINETQNLLKHTFGWHPRTLGRIRHYIPFINYNNKNTVSNNLKEGDKIETEDSEVETLDKTESAIESTNQI